MTELKILNVFNLYILRVCLEMHPFIYPTKQTHRPEHDHNYISATQIHEYPTRYAQQLHQHIPNKYRYTKTTNSPNMENYTKINSNIWNTLPQQLKENRSLSSFKKALRTYLQEQQDKDTRSYPWTHTTSTKHSAAQQLLRKRRPAPWPPPEEWQCTASAGIVLRSKV